MLSVVAPALITSPRISYRKAGSERPENKGGGETEADELLQGMSYRKAGSERPAGIAQGSVRERQQGGWSTSAVGTTHLHKAMSKESACQHPPASSGENSRAFRALVERKG